MTYKKLGLKCGIEIHQQLEGQKLFCSCPTLIRDDEFTHEVTRKLRAVAGESGKIDIAAAQEYAKDKSFVYQAYDETTCLVELDEEPPHAMNSDALYTSLQFSKLVGATVSPIVQVMRKTVVDGSNTSGFQRTALIARSGVIETSEGEISIDNISLEEDSCRNMGDVGNVRHYRLDRLGIPLIEIGTGPQIKSPEQCLEAAKKIGMLLRSLPGVKRGLGTIRQDVNVSIKGGNRIEIKGAQDLKMLPTYVELEVKRQEELLKLKAELKGRKLNTLDIIDVSDVFKDSTSKIIVSTFKKKGKILGIKLEGFAGLVGRELQPGYRLGTEFAGRAKAKAGVGGIFHSDEMPNYGITDSDVSTIMKKLKCTKSDVFILVADVEKNAIRALEAVHERAAELWEGVPKEVRKAHPDGTTRYMRPMPGAARMYPETDVPLVEPDVSTVELPELLDAKAARFAKEFGLSSDLAQFVAKSDKVMLFEELVSKYDIKPAFIADMLVSIPLEISRKYKLDPNRLGDDEFRTIVDHLAKDDIHKDIVLDVMIDMIKGDFSLEKYKGLSTEEIHAAIKKVIDSNTNAPFGALMGKCMAALAGKASGDVVSRELKKILGGGHK